jgi:hypothetical protein
VWARALGLAEDLEDGDVEGSEVVERVGGNGGGGGEVKVTSVASINDTTTHTSSSAVPKSSAIGDVDGEVYTNIVSFFFAYLTTLH